MTQSLRDQFLASPSEDETNADQGASLRDQFLSAQAPTRPLLTRPTPPSDDGDFMRGLKRTLPELKQLAGGTLAAVGDVTGWDGLRDKGLEIYRNQENSLRPLIRPTDSASEAWNQVKQGNFGAGVDFLQNAAGYTTGQALESLTAMGAGAALGAAVTPELAGAGSIPGAIGGFVGRQALKRAVKGQAEKIIAEQVAQGVARREAKQAGAEFVAQRATRDALDSQLRSRFTQAQINRMGGSAIGGAAGAQGMNTVMEMGSVYPEAYQAAQDEGRQMTPGEKARAVGGALAAAGVESAADLFNVGRLGHALREAGTGAGERTLRQAAKDYGKRALVEVPEGMLREAGTEAVQTGLERFGARQNLTDAEAVRDYIDSAAVGAVGGGLFGGAAAIRRPSRPQVMVDPQTGEAKPVPSAGNGPISGAVNAGVENGAIPSVPKPTPTITAQEVTARAQAKLDALNRAADGTPDTQTVDDAGNAVTVPGERPRILADNEKALRTFLTENIGNPDALASFIGMTIQPEAGSLADAANAIPRPQTPDMFTRMLAEREAEAAKRAQADAVPDVVEPESVPRTSRWMNDAGVPRAPTHEEATDYLREKMIEMGVQNTGSVSKRAVKDAITQDGETLAARTFNPAFDAARTALFREIEAARETGAPLPQPAASQPDQVSLAVRQIIPSQGEDVGQSNPLEGGRTASAGAVDAGTAAQPAVVPAGGAEASEVSTASNASPQATPAPDSPQSRQAAREANVPADLLAKRDAATERLNAASAAMAQFPTGNMGLTPDAVKATPEWKAAKIELDRATVAARNANAEVVKAQKVKPAKPAPQAAATPDAIQKKADEVMEIVREGGLNLTRDQVVSLIDQKGVAAADKTIEGFRASRAKQAADIAKYEAAKEKAKKPRSQMTAKEPREAEKAKAQAKAAPEREAMRNGIIPTTRLHAGIRSYTPSSQTAQAYFQPGRVVKSYNGQDRVLAFEPEANGNWRVQVQAVDKAGNPTGEPRWHATFPEKKELNAVLGAASQYSPKALKDRAASLAQGASTPANESQPIAQTQSVTAEQSTTEPAAIRIEPLGAKGLIVHGDHASVRAKLQAAGFKKKGRVQGGALRFDAADRPAIEAALRPVDVATDAGNVNTSGEARSESAGNDAGQIGAVHADSGETPEAVPATKQPPAGTIEGQDALFERLRDGAATLADYKAGWTALQENREAIQAQLGKLTKAQLLEITGPRYRNDPKGRLVRYALLDMEARYAVGRSISYTMGSGSAELSIARLVESATQETLDAYAKDVADARAARTARIEGAKDPKTLAEFEDAARLLGGESRLTPEQRARFDALRTDARREQREAEAKRNATVQRVSTGDTGMTLVETKHTQKGHDLFVVRLDAKVERDVYDRLNTAAKRLGGYYSSFRGNGAVPGFQFTTRDAAQHFMALRDGNVDASAQQQAKADAKAEARAETLAGKAAALRERAQESLNRDRKANTARRAAQAAGAEADARALLALADTMDRISQAIESGKARMLSFIRHRSQVETLDQMLKALHWNHLRDKGVNWEKAKDAPISEESITAATLPPFHVARDEAAKLAAVLRGKRGGKQLGDAIAEKIDYADEYAEAVRKEPGKFILHLSGGELALFKTKREADAAVKNAKSVPAAVVKLESPIDGSQWAAAMTPEAAIERKRWLPNYDKKIALSANAAQKIVDLAGMGYGSGVPYWWKTALDQRAMLAKLGIETNYEFREALREYLALREAPKAEDRLRKLERDLVGRKDVGVDFFPTPPAVVQRLIDQADIGPGMRVLEPSAGKGDIAEAMRAAAENLTVDTVEMSSTLRDILEAKGFDTIAHDFLDMPAEPVYDRIVMNPPFGNDNGAAHVRHAYDMLKPGGRLVAVMGAGTRGKAEFDAWLETVSGLAEPLPEGSFKSSFRPTGVATQVVVIDKDGDAIPQPTQHNRSAEEIRNPLSVQEVENAIAGIRLSSRAGLARNGVKVVVVPDYSSFKPNPDGSPHAFTAGYIPGTSTIAIVAMRVRNARAARKALLHEMVGHFGLNLFPPEVKQDILDRINRTRDGKALSGVWKEIKALYADKSEIEQAEEVFARIAEDTPSNMRLWWDRFIANVLTPALRKLGLVGPISKSELRVLAAEIARGIREGAVQRTAADGSMLEQRVYHGTPHTVDKFSLQKIGTGEGALESVEPSRNGNQGVEFTNGQEALQSRLAQWSASLRVGGSRPRAVAANAEGIGAVRRNAAGAAEQGDSSREEIREQSARLIERAKTEGFYWPDDSPIVAALNALPADRKGGGAEHVAFIVGEGVDRFVIRATDNGAFGHRADISPAQYLARLDDYSETFPSMQTRLIGVSESAEIEGHAVIWTAQPYVRGKKFASQSALSKAMAARGWKEDGYPGVPRFKHEDTGTIIEDAHTDNVFHDDNGDLYPFDVVVEALPQPLESTEDQTQSEAFKRWFGDSKVVDADGKPLVVYHGGTVSGVFDTNRGGGGNTQLGRGAYFGGIGIAEDWVHIRGEGKVGAYYLALERPFDETGTWTPPAEMMADLRDRLVGLGIPPSNVDEELRNPTWGSLTHLARLLAERDGISTWNAADKVNTALREAGFDGIIADWKSGDKQYVAFHPEQIKSADKNNGNFDPNNPSILRSRSARAERTPADAGVSRSGLSMQEGQRLKQRLTAHWGENAPNVVLVESGDALRDVARQQGVDPTEIDERVEGLYLGKPTVWLNLSAIHTPERFAKVLAHEATGHYGVEQVVGEQEWAAITDAVNRHVENKTGAKDVQAAIAQLRRTQAGIFTIKDAALRRQTIAKEVIAVMTENGSRNGLVMRVIAAVRRFLRKLMPGMAWRDADIRDLILQAHGFMREGRTTAQRQAQVQAHAFSVGVRSAFTDAANFAKAVRDFVANPNPQPNPKAVTDIQVTQGTPDVYAKLGVADKPFVIRRDKLKAILEEHPEITVPVLQQLVRHLHEPVAVFQSGANSTNPNGLVALTELEIDGKPVMIAMNLGVARKDGVVVNQVSSYYGRDGREKFLRNIGALRYIDQSKAPAWLSNDPKIKDSRAAAKASGRKILTDADVVKPFTSGTGNYSQAAPNFYSAMLEAVDAGKGAPKKADAAAWKGWMDGAVRRGEFKQAERDWLGVDAWLDGRENTTRAEIADFIRANEVRIEEVTLGQDDVPAVQARIDAINAEYESIMEANGGWQLVENLPQKDRARIEELTREHDRLADVDMSVARNSYLSPKFGRYQLPGGQNYRELLLTLPSDTPDRDSAPEYYSATTNDFRSSHFDQPNILAHVRFNERTDADGKRVLFLEEIQSDWHQAGRKKGYAPRPLTEIPSDHTIAFGPGRAWFGDMWSVLDAAGDRVGKFSRDKGEAVSSALQAINSKRNERAGAYTPDAPFKATDEWAMLAFKRMVRMAAEQGFDRIAWTTGEIQAERYDLSKQVDRIRWRVPDEASIDEGAARRVLIDMVQARDSVALNVDSNGVVVSTGQFRLIGKRLDEIIGKENADKIMSGEPKGSLSGDGLKVGGSGMRGFYDKILPSAVNKWAKKFGGKVGQARLGGGAASYESLVDAAQRTGRTQAELDAMPVAERKALVDAQLPHVHSLDLTPQMRDAALQGLPLFSRQNAPSAGPGRSGPLLSRAPAEVLADIEADMRAVNAAAEGGDGSVARIKQWLKDATPKELKDRLRGAWLGALTTRMLTTLGQDYFPAMRLYTDYLAEMQASRNEMQQEGEDVSEAVRKWAGKHKQEAADLFDLMHKATIAGVDPAEDYQPLTFKVGKQWIEVNKQNVKDRIAVLRDQMLGRGGDDKRAMMDEAKTLRGMLRAEPHRKAKYPALVEKWNQLSPEAQEHYRTMRDLYAKRHDATEAALIQRINDLKMEGGEKRKAVLIDVIRQQFESQRLQGVYFPLQRFGQYFVAAEKGATSTFQMFGSLPELKRAVAALRDRGYTITAQGLKSAGKAKDAPSGTFVAEVIEAMHKAHVDEKVQDEIYQMYLQALPELSMRKHKIHRKAIPGWDTDALRAFSFNMLHGAHQIARLQYAHKLSDTIDVLKAQQDAARKAPDADTARITAGDHILEELRRRHEWIMNPQDSNLTNLVTSAGFTYYLGLTPAAALVNLTQVPMITLPYLGSRFGHAKASKALFAAMKASARTGGHIQRTLTSQEEIDAHKALQRAGALDKTQVHNLAGIAEGGMAGFNPKWAKAMAIIGLPFHKAEVINREATGMAAFRLARAEGKSPDEAVKFAADAIHETQFDYSNANRARYMQSGPAKVLLMFRQYSQNLTWHIARMVFEATKHADPDVRRIARRNLAGVLGMSALFSGTLGLPLMSMTMGILNAIAASFGDDDEPWDAETEFRAFLNDMLGKTGANVVLHGAANAVTGADIASRVSYSDLWFRDADRELDGRGQYYNLLEQAAGPMGGVLKNALVGKQMIDEGRVMRGIETMMPKAIKDGFKALRYADEGVNNLRGDPIVAAPGARNVAAQFIGFTPAEVAAQYDENRSLKNYEQHVLDRRRSLMDAYAMAIRLSDADGRQRALEQIRKFNRAWPQIALTPDSIRRSMRARAKYDRQAENGIMLNRKIAGRVRDAVGVE